MTHRKKIAFTTLSGGGVVLSLLWLPSGAKGAGHFCMPLAGTASLGQSPVRRLK